MSVPIEIDGEDVAVAADFLQQFLTDEIPDGDFTKGTALRDLTVQAVAAVVAFLRAEAAQGLRMRSLKTIQEATDGDPEALRDGVVAILSNLLVTPKNGGKARGFVIGHATQQVDVFIPTTVRFTHTDGVSFVVDADTDYLIPAAELTPVTDADGSVLDYEFRIPLVAVATGTSYNIQPAMFATFDRFNPYVTRVESTAVFSGGRGPETVEEILTRAPDAVSVRNLINDRSIPATLVANFDGIESVLVVGMGDPEMQRDVIPAFSEHLRFHVGGMVDVYLRTALVEASFVGAVGDLFPRPDGIAAIFRDGSESFSDVLVGDIIRVVAGLPIVPAEFLVVENGGDYLVVSERAPFPIATDEAIPSVSVAYTIGRVGPSYADVLSDIGGQPLTTGVTSRRVAAAGRITLPGGPVMDIVDVAIINPPGVESAYKSMLDGFVHFPVQVNGLPSDAASATEGLQFRTIVHNPLHAQSASQWMEVVVGTDANPTRFDGMQLRVRYRSIESFAAIDAFVRGRRERVLAAHQMPRGHHPVVVGMVFTYTLRSTATELLDDDAIAQTIIDYVNDFDATSDAIDVSSIIEMVRTRFPAIANIVPSTPGGPILTIRYELRAPTGDVLGYATNDVVLVDATKQVSGPALMLGRYGVTGRTLRYVANPATIVVRLQGS